MRHTMKALAAALVLAALLSAQEPTAQITGIITDKTAAVVPGARIQVTNTDTGMTWTADSNDSGNYVFSNLRPGAYEVSVGKDGFATVRRTGITLVISQTARLDFTLQVG